MTRQNNRYRITISTCCSWALTPSILDRGVSTHNEDEARLNRKMCEVAERIIVVTDSSKFNRSSLHKIIDTQRIDMIIVDEGIPAESLDGLRKSGIEVVLV
ncbi:DNA-binding transcriptional regulator AgaR [Enterobacter asburiae]|uniref:DNA-binding transcriptional regulator AgaR n=1 Tax=Enterobacter asburiae TaxID=61645 RepID=A0A376FFT9_ENTAS|nr:DNA-binding transcriptional regulator AgaR [Enterobacter asburiae]